MSDITVGRIEFNQNGEILNKSELKKLFEGLGTRWPNPADYRFDIDRLEVTGRKPNKNVIGEVSCIILKHIEDNSIIEVKVARYSFESNSSHFGITQQFINSEEDFKGYDELCIFLKAYCAALLGQKFYWSCDVRNI